MGHLILLSRSISNKELITSFKEWLSDFISDLDKEITGSSKNSLEFIGNKTL